MWRRSFALGIAMALVAGLATGAVAQELKVIKAQKVKDVEVRLLNEEGRWKKGANTFVVEFTKDKKPVDVGKATLNTSMPMPGMAPMLAGATLEPEGPGRYKGKINFPDSGDRQVTVAWDGPAGKGSTKFSVPVR